MWLRYLSWCLGVWLMTVPLRAGMLDSAWRARELLGPGGWAQVLRIEKDRPWFARPAVVHALVFELEDRLWYYADNLGTQSLSLVGGRLARDKSDLSALLREIEPGFSRYEVMRNETKSGEADRSRGELPQGCFIECVGYLRAMIRAGKAPDEARLVAYYVTVAGDTRGHTVLYFMRAGRRYYYDPAYPSEPRPIPPYVSSEAQAIADLVAPGFAPPRRAVFLPLRVLPADNSTRGDRRLVAGGPAAEEDAVRVMSK